MSKACVRAKAYVRAKCIVHDELSSLKQFDHRDRIVLIDYHSI